MGRVVKLDASAGRGPAGAKRSVPRRPASSKTALVLGGGGFTGGVYEIGALRALELLSVNRTINDLDVYVGTSAGAFVAAAVANGATPEEMMRVIVKEQPAPFPDTRVGALLRPNYRELITRGVRLPWRLAHLLLTLGRDVSQVSALDVMLGLAGTLPAGLYSTEGIEAYVREILSGSGRTDDFRELRAELYLAATDLDSCERVAFGSEGWDAVPISTAVSASCALPIVYRPVRVGEREYADGGILSTTNLDIAVQAGARLVIVINPLVPYVNDAVGADPAGQAPRVADMGFPHIGFQSFKLLAHQRLHEQARHWGERYPGVDIILIEPDRDDDLMFRTSIMNFSSRVGIARHGFQSVTLKLAQDYPHFKRIFARHGIEISATRVRQVVERLETERGPEPAWRKILAQTTSALLRQSAGR